MDTILDAEALQHVACFLRAVGGIGVKCCLIAQKQGVALTAIVNIAGGDGLAMDETVFVNVEGLTFKIHRWHVCILLVLGIDTDMGDFLF